MLTLAIDTTADSGGIALADETGVREEALLDAPRGFSRVLFAEIEALLARAGARLAGIELFAGASGPGSFTGVRVGLSAVKGLAEVLGRRV
ncbi:MAG TPA: tRNA (adenosine(37)-N6)-threonylcarbamoyltransferase complex dimerization subunit type 1 TsaB, partial [Bryobacteraceae bacterium]|nr:tRNA (adenosine(37)-N6)-threonylcarbamoyltransferase complex dimerization subunit type 1 TsaB [Bryobacteraceae bacterium]